MVLMSGMSLNHHVATAPATPFEAKSMTLDESLEVYVMGATYEASEPREGVDVLGVMKFFVLTSKVYVVPGLASSPVSELRLECSLSMTRAHKCSSEDLEIAARTCSEIEMRLDDEYFHWYCCAFMEPSRNLKTSLIVSLSINV